MDWPDGFTGYKKTVRLKGALRLILYFFFAVHEFHIIIRGYVICVAST